MLTMYFLIGWFAANESYTIQVAFLQTQIFETAIVSRLFIGWEVCSEACEWMMVLKFQNQNEANRPKEGVYKSK
jgi:hypothetical protein